MGNGGPVEIAQGVWWVGAQLDDDQFQCHAYYIENGDEGVLLDPGSPLTIDETLAKVAQIAPLESIKYLVCHHPDPDIAASLHGLSSELTREDVLVVTEWRARALLKHYGHRFDYYLVEEHDWRVPLGPGRDLEFQLTPYLHFPGAMVSYDTRTGTLFSSDLFGGFVPDSDVLVSEDLDYIIESARPFHQHYMPSRELLSAGLGRIQQRWPDIAQVAPQHGHIIPTPIVDAAFSALKDLECGVFTLADADIDLRKLLRIAEAKASITEALLMISDPASLVVAFNRILGATREATDLELFIDLPDEGWAMWGPDSSTPHRRAPDLALPTIELPGSPAALLSVHTPDDAHPDENLMRMLGDMASTVRPAVDDFVSRHRQSQASAALLTAAMTDPLTGLGNRRALERKVPPDSGVLISLDLDHFKAVNDTFGHGAGDIVLTEVAQALRRCLRDGDSVYRLGGEEFLVCLPNASTEMGVAVAERIRTAVGALDLTGLAPNDRITVSIGVAARERGSGEVLSEALSRADAALYESKESGRDRVTVHAGAVQTGAAAPVR